MTIWYVPFIHTGAWMDAPQELKAGLDQLLIQIFREPSRLFACQELKGTTFLRGFQAFPVRS